jgi:hypothetical protein
LPNPFTDTDRAPGYRYDISVLQAEFSLTQMLDRPVSGRIFFEQVIRDNLDIGRPDQVGLVFERRVISRGRHRTPGRFRTRVITDGVTPSLHVDYKHTTIKAYHKERRALRTETTINNTHDFEIGKRLVNLPALREIGFHANRRLLGVQRLDHDPIIGARDLHTLTDPVVTDKGTRVPGLRLGQQRSHALLAALLTFRLLPHGFANRDLRVITAQLRVLGRHRHHRRRVSWSRLDLPAVTAQSCVAVGRPSAASTRDSSVKSPIRTRTGSGRSLNRVGTANTPRETTTSGCWYMSTISRS